MLSISFETECFIRFWKFFFSCCVSPWRPEVVVLQTLVFSLGPGSELRQIRYCTTFFSPVDSDAMCLSGDLRLYQIAHSWDWFFFILEWGPSYWYPLPFHSMSRKYTCPNFLLPHARWMPALTFSLTLRWRFSYLPWNFMWFFFLLPANLWKGVPATQCRKNKRNNKSIYILNTCLSGLIQSPCIVL